MRKTYSGLIHHLEPNEYFVFGSNTEGRHGKGAALTAKRKFGAIYGRAAGFQGNSYAIITKDLNKSHHPSVHKHTIINQIDTLYATANDRPDLKFYVAYSGTAENLNGYSPAEMAEMFSKYFIIPSNIIFEESFWMLLQTS
jgi:hypothetical protein